MRKIFSILSGMVIISVILALCGGLFVLLAPSTGSTLAPSESASPNDTLLGDSLLYRVPHKSSVAVVARELETLGLIPNARLWTLYLRARGQDRKLKAGWYHIEGRSTIPEVADLLTSGRTVTRTVTIPEGKASWELPAILSPHLNLDSATIDSLAHDADFAASLNVPASGLEGYLFPDTYRLGLDATEPEVLRMMVRRFFEVLSTLDTSSSPLFAEHGLHGWVTMSSIVEKEAAVASERDRIAGVFTNRLREGWSLGADPTVRYAFRKLTGPIYQSQLRHDSPYNTRKFPGLPPGPICNPGKEALRASLDPPPTRYMYFVAKDDGSREHFFSINEEQHNRYKRMAQANRMKRGINN